MDITNYISKKSLTCVCIIIIILIILRILYDAQYDAQYNIEGFDTSNNLVSDLLSKYKSTDAQKTVDLNNINTEMQITSWSNKIYNMQNSLQQSKAIAFYKPNLTINTEHYCKLGDIVSQNADYSFPSVDQFTLLIKKNTSDIKLPIRFDLITDMSDPNFNETSYNYDKYIDNTLNINNVKDSLVQCSQTINALNALITKHASEIDIKFSDKIRKDNQISIGDQAKSIDRIINYTTTIEGFDSNLDSTPNVTFGNEDDSYTDFLTKTFSATPSNTNAPIKESTNTYSLTIYINTELILPAGIQGYIATYDKDNNIIDYVDISIPSSLDSDQDSDASNVINKLSLKPFNNLTTANVRFRNTSSSIYNYIPITEIINYIINLCTNIKNIYLNQVTTTPLITELKLAPNLDTVNNVLKVMTDSLNDTKITLDLLIKGLSTPITIDNDITKNDTLLQLVLYYIKNMNVPYYLTHLKFNPYMVGCKTTYKYIDGEYYNTHKYKIFITNFINPFTNTNTPLPSFINGFNAQKNTLIPTIKNFSDFVNEFNNSSLKLRPFQIYKPIAPENYTSLGYVYCNKSTELQKIIDSKNVACVPSHCVKEIRDWNQTDKIYEFNKDNKYFAIYFNPFTGTFISTNTQQLPVGKVCKVVACVAKCTAIDKLQKADECARQYYNLNKQSTGKIQLSSKLSSNQEEVFYLDKIKAQSDSISRLKSRAQNMQMNIDKATIVNREMNKNKLQDYVDTQKINIDIIMKQLQADKNKIKTNINAPLDTLNALIQMIKDSSRIEEKQKNELIQQIVNTQKNSNIITSDEYNKNLNQVLNSCPEYDLSSLVKKSTASDVCYGCDVPR
jgi:hypothetical protein